MKPLFIPTHNGDQMLLIQYDNKVQYDNLRLFLHEHGWIWRDRTPLNALDKVPHINTRNILVVTKVRKRDEDYNDTVTRSMIGSDLEKLYRSHLCSYADMARMYLELPNEPEAEFFTALDKFETKLKNHASNKKFIGSFW